jgi:hypothetical protein
MGKRRKRLRRTLAEAKAAQSAEISAKVVSPAPPLTPIPTPTQKVKTQPPAKEVVMHAEDLTTPRPKKPLQNKTSKISGKK